MELTSFFEEFNFDMLSSLVEEMNRFQESPRDAVRFLNISSNGDLEARYQLKIMDKNDKYLNSPGVWKGNPLRPEDTPTHYWVSDEEDEAQIEITMRRENLVEKIPSKGIFRYEVGDIKIALKNLSKSRDEHW